VPLLPRSQSDPQGLAVDDLECRRSWSELEDRVTRMANGLRDDFGLAPDDHVGLLMHNRAEAIEGMLAGIAAGLWVTPINWHLTRDEIAYVVRDSGARVVFADAAHAEQARAAGAPAVIEVGDELEGWLADASDAPIDLAGPAGGNMIYTSGTTGRPKGVQRARAATLEAALDGFRAYADTIDLDGRGPHLITGPMYHAAPLMLAVYEQQQGAPVVIMPRWDDEHCLQLIEQREIRHTHLVPTMFVRLLRLPGEIRERYARPALHRVLHGAAPVSPEVKRKMIDWWGPILLEYWGGTEGGVNTIIHSEEWLAHPGTVGRALPPFEVFATDDDGRQLAAGEIGTLYCRDSRSDRPFAYHADPDKTEAAYLEPGVFTLGDMGFVDEDGYVYLADRKSNMIISGGVNIYPLEIEQVLMAHPAVADVGVFGIPDEEWGESVKAAVELVDGVEPSSALADELLAFARERLAGYKAPRSIDFEAELPRHPSGKLYLRRLRDPYWEGRDRRI
jgi:long-chain acyl-CoA synthetase